MIYSVQKTPEILNIAKQYAQELKLKIVIIDQNLKPFVESDYHIRDAGLYEFVYLLNNANFIVTDSFHGTSFAINLEIPFVVADPKFGRNRITSLLETVGLNECLISSMHNITKTIHNIDFNQSTLLLEEARSKSLKYIENALKSSHK